MPSLAMISSFGRCESHKFERVPKTSGDAFGRCVPPAGRRAALFAEPSIIAYWSFWAPAPFPAMHSSPLRAGLVGFGFAGQTFHAPVLSAVPGLQLAAVASSRPHKVHEEWPEVDVVPDTAAL